LRRQGHEEDSVGEVVQQFRSGLQREARLAGATGSNQGQQLDIILSQETNDLLDLPLPTEEGRRLPRQVIRPIFEGLEGRKLRRKVWIHQLKDSLRLQQIAQPMLAEVSERHP
jgi:hypothetical protein